MTHELLLHQITVKKLAAQLNLAPRDVDVLLLLHSSRTLSTPSIYRVLGTRKSEINNVVGPKLVEAGWVKRHAVVHNKKSGLPTNRWTLVEESIPQLEALIRSIRRSVLENIGLVFNDDHLWTTNADEAPVT